LSPVEKERVMAVVARIVGYSLLTAGPGACWFGYALSVHDSSALVALLLACVGAIVGAVAGAAGEIVAAQRRLTRSEAMKPMSKALEVGD
jgi:FtsH-binding integral membrane protein